MDRKHQTQWPSDSADDVQTMQAFHYSQELKRTLKLFASFAVAFSFISITTGIFTNYGFVLNTAGPLGIWTWPIVSLLTSLVLSGVFGTLFLMAATLSIPDVALITNSPSPLPAIIESNLGTWIGTAFLVLVIISIFACGLVIMTSGSRLIYAMARDNVFFFSSFFKKISPTTGVPVPATVLLLVIGILATLFSNSLTLLVGATSVLPAILYLITVASYTWGRHRLPDVTHGFSLGRWGRAVAWLAMLWLVAEIGILTIPAEFHQVTLVAGILLAVGALFYVGIFRRRIAEGKAGVHPVEQ